VCYECIRGRGRETAGDGDGEAEGRRGSTTGHICPSTVWRACTHTHAHRYMLADTQFHTHTHTHTHTHSLTHTHTHTHTQVLEKLVASSPVRKMLKGERSIEPIYTVGQVWLPPSVSVRPSLSLPVPASLSCLPVCLSVCVSACHVYSLRAPVSCTRGTREQVSKNFTLVLDGNVDVKAGVANVLLMCC
jgi:hypothetical protein